MDDKFQEHTKYLNIESDNDKILGNVRLIYDNKFIGIQISQNDEDGMTAEIQLNITKFQRVVKALEKAYDLILNGAFHHERETVDIIYTKGSTEKRKGFVLVSIFEDSIIIVVSLTNGGDPYLMIRKKQISELITLFQTVKAN
ncbi:hypothetical protein [Paenibacillus periandrae]|uniref:hypothetical protein n=1 Tax=Paenibacillus periandrae TaxID=1761741 RepID=UPI001F0936C0|nr:hypothetical protein [Paenibacillus periandrae]